MVRCLSKELELHASDENARISGMPLLPGAQIATIYFGGGTPSILQPEEISSLLENIFSRYDVLPQAEITIEANPDDISPEKLAAWKSAGINRLSLGIQSFIERDLQWMHRAHNAAQALKSIEMALASGFDNLSADLIFGIPGLSDDEWIENIQRLTAFNIPHVASYALTVEPETALLKMIGTKKKEAINNEHQARQFELLMDVMDRQGYEHYEISNFAKPGYRSRHNSSYWQQQPYLGIGPSAHSFDGNHRYWNVSNNVVYMNSVELENTFFEMETLTSVQKLNEYIMTSLRTIEGLDLEYVREIFSEEDAELVKKKLNDFPGKWLNVSNQYIRLTSAGKLFADKISAELFF